MSALNNWLGAAIPAWAAAGQKLGTVPSPRAAIEIPPLRSAVALGKALLARASPPAGVTIKQVSRSEPPVIAQVVAEVVAAPAVPVVA